LLQTSGRFCFHNGFPLSHRYGSGNTTENFPLTPARWRNNLR
jgi:hypothetical protein